jgi:colanic acid/amylovoran biosynthesis glycosyltransferase
VDVVHFPGRGEGSRIAGFHRVLEDFSHLLRIEGCMISPEAPQLTTCVVVNKNRGALAPSESFLRAHIEQLPGRVRALIGNPCMRREGLVNRRPLMSLGLVSRGSRWLARRTGLATLERQDTRSLARYLTRERIQVVLAEYGPTAVTVLPACEEAKIPLVTHFHGWDAYVLGTSPEHASEYRAVFHASEAIIAVSRHQKRHLESIGAPADRVIWNPCGAEVVQGGHVASPERAPPTFITVGRPAPKKATIVSLLAFARVAKERPEARLELVGVGLDSLLHQATLALGFEDSVHFLGLLSHNEVLERLSAARCYVHPSVTAPDGDMEGTPVSVMEAMAAGLPVVATRHGGILDLLAGTSAGILVDEYDVDATARGMLVYADDPDRAGRDGREGRRLIQERWSMERSLGRLAEVLRLAAARDAESLARMASQREL